MGVATAIRSKLTDALAPARLDIVDESHLHAGHSGARDGGESHFRLEIVSEAFAGKSRLDRQRMVYGFLADEFDQGLHALAMKTLTPAEDAQA